MNSEIERNIFLVEEQLLYDNIAHIDEILPQNVIDVKSVIGLKDEINQRDKEHEMIPLRILSILVILFHKERKNINTYYIYTLIKGLNYYGLYNSIKEVFILLKEYNYSFSSDKVENILLLLQYAKFQKNNGEINRAIITYNTIFSILSKNNQILIAYVLSSYANFCNDYLLREGKYRVFCKIAYQRLKTINTDNFTDREKRWKQIIQDTYAKSISKDKDFDSIYRSIDNEVDNIETHLRINLRWIELKINRVISELGKGINEYDKITDYINEYQINYYKLANTNNPKAKYIRKLKFYILIRLIEDARVEYSKRYSQINRNPYLDNLLNNVLDCIDDLDDISRESLKFNDRKSYAHARFEMAIWSEKWGEKKDTIKYLDSAKKIIFCNALPISASLYLTITQKLAESYSNSNEFKKSIECYQDLYVFIDVIMNYLIKDKNEVDNSKNEYSLLNCNELSLINDSIISDYQFLATSISSIYNQILMTQIKSGVISIHNYLDSIIHDTNNDLKIINTLLNKYILSQKKKEVFIENDNNKISKCVDDIKNRLLSFRKNIEVDEISYFDIVNYSEMILKSFSKDNSYNIKIDCLFRSSIKLKFSMTLLYSIYQNILNNLEKISSENNIVDSFVKFDIILKDDGFYYFFIKDNCGQFDKFNLVINSINNKCSYGNKRHGLEIIKDRIDDLFNINKKWILCHDNELSNCKILQIPFAKMNYEL